MKTYICSMVAFLIIQRVLL